MAILKVLGGYLECEGGGIGEPSHPITYPPGSPPSGGMPGQLPIYPWLPAHPIYNPPAYPSHPIQPVGPGPSHPIALPPGGTPVPPDTINPPLPEPPPEYANQTIVAVKHPGQDWKVATYDVGPDQGMPQPTPHG